VHNIEFRIVEVTRQRDPVRTIEPHVDGRSLIEIVKAVELPAATEGREPDLAGAYYGLTLTDEVAWPSRHFLGEPVLQWFADGDTVLLGCQCGDWGCWPLTANVAIEGTQVVWDGFRHGHRDWSYAGFERFVFDADQYEAALRRTAKA
jgi:hypothetical protein